MKFLIYLISLILSESIRELPHEEVLYDFRACFQEKMKIKIVFSLGETWEPGESQPQWEKIFQFLEDFELIRNNYEMMQQIEFILVDLGVRHWVSSYSTGSSEKKTVFENGYPFMVGNLYESESNIERLLFPVKDDTFHHFFVTILDEKAWQKVKQYGQTLYFGYRYQFDEDPFSGTEIIPIR